MTAPQVHTSDLGEVKAWINVKAAKAIRQVDECVRFVEMLRDWMAYERHLLESCDQPACDDCNARTWLLGRLESLHIPVLPSVGADSAGGGEGMGTRVTKPLGGDAEEAAFDRDWLTNGNGGN